MTSQNNVTSAFLRDAGYNMFHYCRPDRPGGGVAILAKTTFLPKSGKTLEYKTFEVHIQNFKLFNNLSPVTLVIVYRLGKECKADFLNEFYEFTEFLSTNYSYFLICGDFNIHVNKPTETFVSNFKDLLDTFSLVQSVHEPTHVCGNTLDLIIHNPIMLQISNIHVEKPDKSDHSLIFFSVTCNLATKAKKNITFRKLRNVNHTDLKKDIDSASNLFLASKNEVNFEQSVTLFNQIFEEVVDTHAPKITKSVNVIQKPGWLDQAFKSARSERRKLYKIWNRYKNDESREPADRQRFESSRNEVHILSVEKRTLYYSKCIADSNNSQKERYKICNSLLDVQKCRSLPDCDDPDFLANEFNQYFIHKIDKIRSDMSTVNVSNVHVNKLSYGMDGPTCARTTLSKFTPISQIDLKKIILSRKIKTSSEDFMPAVLLKSCLDEILPALTELVNISLTTGSIHGLKDAVIIPLLKKQGLDTEKMANYRPVANILYLSKLIEFVVSLQLKDHMDANQLHISNQSGYKPNHSCETLLLRLTNDVLMAMDSGKFSVFVLVDLSSAFDTVEHERLQFKLFNEIGLRDQALDWFKSYLENRRQAVTINGKVSDFLDIAYGVPQGSVLGPTLFNIYVRSLISILQEAGFIAHGYADDHQVTKAFRLEFQFEALRWSIPLCLDIIAHWMKASFLKLNASKTQIIVFTPKNLASHIHIDQVKLSDGCVIPVSTMVSNLGSRLDSQLSYVPHINSICSQSYRLLRNLAAVRKFISTDDLRLLVQSIVVSRIDNCNSLLYGILALNINKLQKLQNFCARLIYKKKRRDHVTPLLVELHWLPIRQRIVFKILLITFKFYLNMAPLYISEIIEKSERNELLLKVPRASTPYGDRAFSICAPRLWNALPLHIRASNSMSYFRSHLKHHLFTHFDAFISQANIYID